MKNMYRFLRRPKFLVAAFGMFLLFAGLLRVLEIFPFYHGIDPDKFNNGGTEMKDRNVGRMFGPKAKGGDMDSNDETTSKLEDYMFFSKGDEGEKKLSYRKLHTEILNTPKVDTETKRFGEPNYRVHIFYYPWYGNPKHDGKYIHWNHEYLPHWNPEIAKRYQRGRHVPPDDIGANFYPSLGPYSSRDPGVIEEHMKEIRAAGVGVLVVSWYPPYKADEQGIPWDSLIMNFLDAALRHKLKLALHIEPYKGRNDYTVHKDVEYIINKYGKHKAFYKQKTKNGRYLPILYIYDSYHTKPHEWAQLLTTTGSHSVRNTKYDCVFICLMVEMEHRSCIETGGFDGFYTYFAIDRFTYGSTWRYWGQLSSLANKTGTLFIPSVGPGYIDTNVRPWNAENTRSRQNGEYYRKSWRAAMNANPDIISITSFNEWHEGTQIERAVPKTVSGIIYRDYGPNPSDYYLKLTKEFVDKFDRQ